jgi:hypothetical protein
MRSTYRAAGRLLGGMLGEGRRGGRFFKPVTLSVPIRGGGVLVVDSRPSAIVRARLRERALIGVFGGLAILLVLLLAVRQATRPLVAAGNGRAALLVRSDHTRRTGDRIARDA